MERFGEIDIELNTEPIKLPCIDDCEGTHEMESNVSTTSVRTYRCVEKGTQNRELSEGGPQLGHALK